MIGRWIVAMAVVLALGVALSGCINVKAPEGPYVKFDSNPDPDSKTLDLKNIEKVIEKARQDGIITKDQGKKLKKRFEKQFED